MISVAHTPTRCIGTYKRPLAHSRPAAAPHRCTAPPCTITSRSRPARFFTFAVSGDSLAGRSDSEMTGGMIPPDIPPDMSTSGKSSSHEAQLEGHMEGQRQEEGPPVTPNPDAAKMADANVVNEREGAPEHTSMSMQDRAPAADIGSSTPTTADKVAQGMQQVAQGTASGQTSAPAAEENWAGQQAGIPSPESGSGDKGNIEGGSAGEEFNKGRM